MAKLTFARFVVFLALAISAAAEDWPSFRHDLSNTGLSGASLTSSNVSSLRLKWSLQLGGIITASPVVATINSVSTVFVGSGNGVFYAVNALTGQTVWSYQIDVVAPCSSGSCRIASSASVANGVVYFGAENAFLYALNAATGALVWKQQVADPTAGYEIQSSPAVYNGVVYVGLASHNESPCVAGQVLARNAATGAPIWSFSTIDQNTCSSGSNCTGAEVWASPALDTKNGILYVGTGHPGSMCSVPGSDAGKYPNSILALRMADGTLLNYFQPSSTGSTRGFYASPVLFYTSPYNCTLPAHNWVGEPNEDGSVYYVQRNSTGLITSIVSSRAVDQNGFKASPPLHLQGGGGLGCTISDYLYLVSGNLNGGTAYRVNIQDSGVVSVGWTNSVSSPTPIYSSPSASVDVEFFGSNNGKLYVLFAGQQGQTLWTYQTGGAVESGPSISNNRVYFGSDDGFLRCVSVNGQ